MSYKNFKMIPSCFGQAWLQVLVSCYEDTVKMERDAIDDRLSDCHHPRALSVALSLIFFCNWHLRLKILPMLGFELEISARCLERPLCQLSHNHLSSPEILDSKTKSKVYFLYPFLSEPQPLRREFFFNKLVGFKTTRSRSREVFFSITTLVYHRNSANVILQSLYE